MDIAAAFPSHIGTPRPDQLEVLNRIVQAWTIGKKYILIEAPTGTGKSAIALAAHALMKRMVPHGRSFITTSTKMLQEQYKTDFPYVAPYIGKTNFTCFNYTNCQFGFSANKREFCNGCPYLAAREEAIQSPVAIMSYASFLYGVGKAGLFSPRELFVGDEAHNLESSLLGFGTLSLPNGKLDNMGMATVPDGGEELRNWAKDLLYRLKVLGNDDPEADSETTQALNSLALFLDDASHNWVASRDDKQTQLKPLNSEKYFRILNEKANKMIFMSATMTPAFAQTYGLDLKDVEMISVPSTFPKENRPINAKIKIKTNYKELDSNLPQITDVIGKILKKHSGQSGIIHTGTYKVQRYLEVHLNPETDHTLLFPTTRTKEVLLSKHKASTGPSVLVSPSMTEGIDLPGSQSEFQVIAKIFYPNLGDPFVIRKKEKDSDWYTRQAAFYIVQAYGRSIRSPTDKAKTYIIDASFQYLIRYHAHFFPKWFMEAVTV